MTPQDIDALLANYTALVQRVDQYIQHIETGYADQIACKKGCDACCRFLGLFPVEALALSTAFRALPPDRQALGLAAVKKGEDACPLLIDHQCLIYDARPLICRTHGFPIYMEKDGKPFVDFCPKNFTGLTTLPKDAMLNLEQLNTTLAAVNRHFLECIETDTSLPDRIPMSDALEFLDSP